jgi:hypothetical protein
MHQARVSCDGNYLGLSIDSETVAETFDDSFVSGDVGLAAYNHVDGASFTAAFDNFEAAAVGSQQASGEGETVISDDFSDANSGWATGSEEEWALYYEAGRYFAEVNPSEYSSWSSLAGDYANITINVDVNIEQAAHDGDIGVLCRYEDADNHYALEVSEDGYYSIWKRVNGEVSYLVEWTKSELIPTDSSSFVLNASCDGAQLSVGINGELLATATDTDFASGGVGLLAGTWENGGLVVSFDNFEVIEY